MKKKFISIALALLATLSISAADWYVSTTGDDANDGSKTGPFKTIKKAILSAANNDNINVSEGTYPDEWGKYDSPNSKTLNIYGSWNSDFSARSQPANGKSWEYSTPTIIDAKSIASPSTSFYELAANKGGVIEGFIFNAQFAGTTAVTILAPRSANVKKCIFKDMTFGGGATRILSMYSNSPTITIQISDCLFDNIDFVGGTSGAIFSGGGTYLKVENCEFSRIRGSGLVVSDIKGIATNVGQVTNCVFYNCTTKNQIIKLADAYSQVTNCLLYNNTTIGGSATSVIDGVGVIANTTIANNVLSGKGLELALGGKVHNTVMIGNIISGSTNKVGFTNNVAAEVKNCAFDGANLGASVIAADNITLSSIEVLSFANPSTFEGADLLKQNDLNTCDWQISSASSPLINAGNNNWFTSTAFGTNNSIDLAGANRIQQSIIDMGAYESAFTPASINNPLSGNANFFVENGKLIVKSDQAEITINQVNGMVNIYKVAGGSSISLSKGINIITIKEADQQPVTVKVGI